MPGTHVAHFQLKPQVFHMQRGVKHKDIANGRKGRVGQRLPCTTSTADPDPENNADGEAAAVGGKAAAVGGKAADVGGKAAAVGGEAAAVGGEAAAENQHTGLNLNQAKARDSFSDQINKVEAVLALKGVESQWSYESFNNFVEVLRKADP